ncbi:MAG: PAS domain S-box protein [Phycisphaerae bacterium]
MHTCQAANEEAVNRFVVEAAVDGVITIDDQGVVNSFNPAAERIFGYRLDEVIGKNVNMLMPSPDREQHDGHIARHLQTGVSKGIGKGRERTGRRKDGTTIPLEIAVSEVALPDRRLFAAIVRDIRERKAAEKALSDSKRFLQTIIDQVPESLMVIDRNHRVVLANRTVRAMAGGVDPVSSLLSCHQVSHHCSTPCNGDHQPCPLDLVVSRREPVSVIHAHTDHHGDELLLEIIAAPVFDEHGEVIQIIESSRDITARVRAEEHARQRHADFAHMARLGTVGEMAASLAHELNQPLSAIVNYTQACLERLDAGAEDPAELRRDLMQVALQAERAGGVVEHVRNFVRKGDRECALADINELARDALELLSAEMRQSGVRVSLSTADSLPPVLVTRIEIEQVLVNLVQNALEAMTHTSLDKRLMTVSTSRGKNGWIELLVSDSGPGVPKRHLTQLFEPFFSTKPDGMGMGLAISRSIVETHGGRLQLQTNGLGGATFQVLLPTESGAPSLDN